MATIASLVVTLSAEVSDFHDKMEASGRHMEQVGRRIARAGHEITLAVAPFAAIVAGGLAAAVKQSALVHGELAQAWDRLTLSARELFREIGSALTPAFLNMAQAKGGLIEKARQLVAWFEQLSPATQSLIVKTGLFLAALGPTIFAVGAAVRAFGALWSILTMLSALVSSVLLKALAFLVSPIGLVIVGVGLLVAAVALLIRHWQQVKQVGLEAWNALKLGVLNMIDGILAGFERLAIAAHLPGLVDTFTNARDALGVMRWHTLKEGEALDELGRHIVRLPLLPDWLRHPLKALAIQFPSFALPKVPPLPTLQVLQATDVLAKLDTQMKENLQTSAALGSSFDLAAANAQAYKNAVDELIKLGISVDTVIGRNGLTIRDLANRFKDLSAQVHLSLGPAIGSALQGFATAIGDVVSGATKSLKGFGGALLQVVGSTMVSLGGALIMLGTAKLAAWSLNPLAAIGVGAALVVFGKALSNAASAIANPPGTGGGGGGGAAAAPAAASSSEGSSTIILELHGDSTVAAMFQDVRNQDALAQALKDLTDRNVIVQPVFG
jgi:phage-related protein